MDKYSLFYLLIIIIMITLVLIISRIREYLDEMMGKRSRGRFIFVLSVIGLLMFSFMAPFYFADLEKIKNEKPSEVGDAIGGLMGLFIGIAGVIFTFLTFYMQKVANEDIKERFKIQQFESQFYEMVRLHK